MGANQPQDTQLPLREEHFHPGDRQSLVSARADLAELLVKIARELRAAPKPRGSGGTTPALVEGTLETLAHAEALFAAVGRQLDGIQRAAQVAYVRLAEARRRVLATEPTVTVDALREMHVGQLLTCEEIASRCGKSSQDVSDVLSGAGISVQRGRRKPPGASASPPQAPAQGDELSRSRPEQAEGGENS
jgi:hypothetical protein